MKFKRINGERRKKKDGERVRAKKKTKNSNKWMKTGLNGNGAEIWSNSAMDNFLFGQNPKKERKKNREKRFMCSNSIKLTWCFCHL